MKKVSWHWICVDRMGEQPGDVMTPARERYQGHLTGNMGYGHAVATSAIASKQLDAVAFGAAYISTPDQVDRFAANAELNQPGSSTFYLGGTKRYTDYPTLAGN